MSYLITEEENIESCDESIHTNQFSLSNENFKKISNDNLSLDDVVKSLKKVICNKYSLTDFITIRCFIKKHFDILPFYQVDEDLVGLLSKYVLYMNYRIEKSELRDHPTLSEYRQILSMLKKSDLKLKLDKSCFNIIEIIEEIMTSIITSHKQIYKKKKGFKIFSKNRLKIEKLQNEIASLVENLEGDLDSESGNKEL